MSSDLKRKSAPAHAHTDGRAAKKSKNKDYFRKQAAGPHGAAEVGAGQQGFFATCERGREAKAVAELYRMLDLVTADLYGLGSDEKARDGAGAKDEEENGKEEAEDAEEEEEEEEDIAAAISKEVSQLTDKKLRGEKPYVSVKMDAQCVVFFRLQPPCVPTEVVTAMLEGTAAGTLRSRFVQRLSPVTRTARATMDALEEAAREALAPHFHRGQEGVKFAIRPTVRNHSVLRRDDMIQAVAKLVGPQHKVDLKNYDVLILIEVFKNICGVSVVRDWQKLKNYNLAQFQPVSKAEHGAASRVKNAQRTSGTTDDGAEAKSAERKSPEKPAEEKPAEEKPAEEKPANVSAGAEEEAGKTREGAGEEKEENSGAKVEENEKEKVEKEQAVEKDKEQEQAQQNGEIKDGGNAAQNAPAE